MLTGKQKRYLRSLAHNLDPIFQIGKSGINENMIAQIDDTLENRELIKIHVLQNNFDDKNELAVALSNATKSEIVQVIGSMIVIYRESVDNKEIYITISYE
ncbi:ribosome assembly RNA-binding protein YhbY [Staphylococcus haemolyticus]|uniref:ribosome assembly RNA-binding protein YhbY n=1 Tax=Staphylococcus haemolyticus TaxID=1283 RepID=UPI000D1FA18B|nr:ribosome assembly RNA-binding protein YhbY [Staphylococcus haemolyticus]PTK70654.1 ribosome assembly RNA-binding protein YhbY [Staphylococcus haemolyticus]